MMRIDVLRTPYEQYMRTYHAVRSFPSFPMILKDHVWQGRSMKHLNDPPRQAFVVPPREILYECVILCHRGIVRVSIDLDHLASNLAQCPANHKGTETTRNEPTRA